MIANWRPGNSESFHTIEGYSLDMHKNSHGLKSPHAGHVVSITFIELEGYPELMRVYSTNWRCEDEPNAIYRKDDCRAFYRQLIKAGFVVF